jgi:hypothetical protein
MSWTVEMPIDGRGWVRSPIRWPDELAAHRAARKLRDALQRHGLPGEFLDLAVRVVQLDEPPTAQVSEPA